MGTKGETPDKDIPQRYPKVAEGGALPLSDTVSKKPIVLIKKPSKEEVEQQRLVEAC